MTDIIITIAARSALRQAITSHPRWSDFKRSHAKLISQYGKSDFILACQTLNIDIQAVIAASNSKETAVKDRSKDRAEVSALRGRFDVIASRLDTTSRDKASAIFESIQKYGGGMATEAQFAAIAKIVAVGEALPPVGATATATASPVIPVAAPVATAPANPAASNALYDIMRDAVRADLAPMVQDLVTRALDGVQTVKIELTRQGETAGTAEGHQHPLFATLCRVLAARQANGYPVNVWLSGPTGSGKTFSVRQFAKAAGLEFGLHGTCRDEHQLLGYVSPTTGVYQTTAFRERWEHGGVILLDEMDSYDAGATLALNGIADGFINFPDRMVVRHQDCYIVAAGNTWGEGPNSQFVGRAKLDQAYLSRYPVKLAWTYDVALEIAISGNADWARRVQSARVRKDAAGVKHLIDPRHTMAGAALIAQGFTHDEAASITYLAGLSADQVKIVEGRSI